MNILELRKLIAAFLLTLTVVVMLPGCASTDEEEQCVPYPDCLH